MEKNEVKNKAEGLIDKVSQKAEEWGKNATDKLDSAKQQIEESGQDWVKYVKSHPIQTVFLTGLACYLAGRLTK